MTKVDKDGACGVRRIRRIRRTEFLRTHTHTATSRIRIRTRSQQRSHTEPFIITSIIENYHPFCFIF